MCAEAHPKILGGIYTLNTVTYGTACALYLAIRTIKQLCIDEKEQFPQAAKLAQDHFYVDHLLAGADSVGSAKTIIQELLGLMSSGGFELRKWSCSHPEVIAQLPEALKSSTFTHSFQEDSPNKILGLVWDLTTDSFQVRTVPADNVSTKRQLLSIIVRTFDPLEFVAPSTIILKIILQDLWKANLGWDDHLPSDIINCWNKFQDEIHHLKEIKIPCYIHVVNSLKLELHGFSDASTQALAAVAYLRSIFEPIQVSFIASKTKIALVKPVTLPRLELCAALLLAELVEVIRETLKDLTFDKFLHTDSTITLSWILNPPTKGNQFVLHRANKIRTLTSTQMWSHIPGKSNPADCATCVLYPERLRTNDIWWNGPEWLCDLTAKHKPVEVLADQGVVNVASTEEPQPVLHVDLNFDLLTRFSSYIKLIRVIAWI